MDTKIPGKYFKELVAGEEFAFPAVEVTEKMIYNFSVLTGDCNLLHIDEEFASKSHYNSRISQGMLTASLALAPLGNETFNGTAVAMTESIWKFLLPVRIGDLLSTKAKISDKEPRIDGKEGGKVTFEISVHNQKKDIVLRGVVSVLIK